MDQRGISASAFPDAIAGHRKLVAILRGLEPSEAAAIGAALVEAGITLIEVPLNSPEPLESIRRIADALGERALVGAGTVLDPASIEPLAAAGGRFVVAPNVDPAVVGAARAAGLGTMPGVFTATEAFQAVRAGADLLKIFPASQMGPEGIRALKAVLPPALPLYAVGGVDAANVAAYGAAGAAGFGLGSNLFKPGLSPAAGAARAAGIVAAYEAAFPG